MYIRNDLTYKIRNDLCISGGDREILTIELLKKKHEKTNITNKYIL